MTTPTDDERKEAVIWWQALLVDPDFDTRTPENPIEMCAHMLAGIRERRDDLIKGLEDQLDSQIEDAITLVDERDEARVEVERLQEWVNDLQAGMYINCVYCGHRYGPEDEVPAMMAEVLKEHIAVCPKHPLAAAEAECDTLRTALDDAKELLRAFINEADHVAHVSSEGRRAARTLLAPTSGSDTGDTEG